MTLKKCRDGFSLANTPLTQGVVHEDTPAGELEPLADFWQRFEARSETLDDLLAIPSDFGTIAKPQILCEM